MKKFAHVEALLQRRFAALAVLGFAAISCGGASKQGEDVEMCLGNINDGPRPCDDGSILALALAGLLILVLIGIFRLAFRSLAGPMAAVVLPLFLLYCIRNEMGLDGTDLLEVLGQVSLLGLSGGAAIYLMVEIVALVKQKKKERQTAKKNRQAHYDRGLEVLKQFVEREGHGRVPIGNSEPVGRESTHTTEMGLSVWCRDRIRERELGELTEDEIAELDVLGFDWDPEKTRFRRHLGALRQFSEREGHMFPSHFHRESFQGTEVDLGEWCLLLRNLVGKGWFSDGRMPSKEHLAELEELGFFNPNEV